MAADGIAARVHRALDGWDRSGWFRDGLRTFPVGLGVLAVWALVDWLLAPSAIRPPPPGLRLLGVVAVGLLAALGRTLSTRVLRRRDALVAARQRAAVRTLVGYVVLAGLLAVALPRVDANVFAVVLGALAMTAPGVFLVVLDGSPPARAATRVLLAVLVTPAAVLAGYLVGFAAFFVATFIGSFVLGFLAGHLTTFVPLALVGPGPDRVTA